MTNDAYSGKTFKSQASDPNAHGFDLLYSGMANGEMRFHYREFVDEFKRSNFDQEARYQYKQGDAITFKGARIRIIEANNERISYIVEKGFAGEVLASQ